MLKELIEKYNVRSGMSMSKFIYYILYTIQLIYNKNKGVYKWR